MTVGDLLPRPPSLGWGVDEGHCGVTALGQNEEVTPVFANSLPLRTVPDAVPLS